MGELLRIEKISKRFGSFYANKKISLTVEEGEIHTLLGENGAGKSTLMNILVGLYQPTDGKIFLKGQEVHLHSPNDAVSKGIGMVHQHFMLVDAMTVFENIILGDTNTNEIVIDREKRRAQIQELAQRYGFRIDLDKYITEISVGEQQRVEILKALYRGAQLLILDEPTAALTDIEVEGLYNVMHKLVEEGKSIIFISHKMREVMHVSDRITILRAGEAVATVRKEDVDARELANMMIGRDLTPSSFEKVVSDGKAVAKLDHISYRKESKHYGLNEISMMIRSGEIVGIAGVDGNGQTQLAQVLTGVITPEEGTLYLGESRISVYDPNDFIIHGTAHVPEDRNLQGLVGDMSIADNLVLRKVGTDQFSSLHGALLKKGKILSYAKEMIKKYDIRSRSASQPVRSLSGGNQQKVILAREMEAEPDLLVVAHPTRGLDIGATRFIWQQMIAARDRGVGILLISADFDEVLELSDRILVLFEGQIMGEYSGKNPPVDEISLAMTGR